MIINKKIFLALLALSVGIANGYAQKVQYVTEQNITSLSGNRTITDSYYFTKSITITATAGSSVTISPVGGAKFISHLPTNPPPSPNENYVRVEVPKVPVSSEEALTLLGADDKTVTYTYSDGLGRPLMTTVAEAGPNYEDLVQPNYYNSATGVADQSYLPFTSNSSNSGEFINNAHGLTNSYYQNPPNGIVQDFTPYAEVKLEDSPLSRTESQMGTGSDWRNIEFPENNRDSDLDYFLNDGSNVVPRWELNSSGNPVRNVNHPNYTLQIVESENEEGIKTQSITDSRGRNIASRTWYDDSGTARWITTYYIYDAFNRLRFIFPPAIANNTTITSAQLENYAFEYRYDYRGRTIYEKNPGILEILYVYDNRNRLVYSQDAEQRNDNQWIFRKYDRYNRLIMTGIYNSSAAQSILETQVWSATGTELYEIEDDSPEGYTSTQSFPKNSLEIQNITYFDNYNYRNNTNWDTDIDIFQYGGINPFLFSGTSGINVNNVNHDAVKGLTTGSKVKVIGLNQWLNTVIYYDDEYRAVQVVSENHLGSIDRITNQLNDYTGVLEKMKLDHERFGSTLSVLSEYEYDHEFRLLRSWQQINNDPKVLVADYQYNALGQLIEKNLHSTNNGSSFLQSVDYRYNIRGWLNSINNDRLSESESKAQPDIFGANLYYTRPPSVNGSRENRYDGRMAVFSWDADNLQGTAFNRPATEYIYDDLGRLDETDYGADGVWVSGAPNEDHNEINVGYDDQGNIKSMERKSEGTTVDNLTYTYQDNNTSNKLQKVADNAGDPEGFNDRIPASMPNEYEYDDNGNLTRDQHKAMSIEYNYLQMPSAVIFDDGRRIDYTYDATGNRLYKTVTFSDGKTERMDYVGLIEYLNNDIYQIFTDEGRVFKQNDQYFYEYFITDHQGNNRVAFGILPKRNVYKANMESGVSDGEFAFPSPDPRMSGENKTSGGSHSAILNGATNPLGPAKVLSISPNDEVELEVWAKYSSSVTWNNQSINNIVSLVGTSFGGASAGTGAESASSSLNSALGNPGTTLFTGDANPNDQPEAYLQYLFFDDTYTYIPAKSGFVSVSSLADGAWERVVAPKITFGSNDSGYLFIYVANETNQNSNVYFDDLKIIHESPTAEFKVSQINEYYPFGLLTTNSWRNPNFEDPGMLYQSYYATYDSLTEYNDFFLRNYDPAIGRWMQNDPYGQFASPYLAMSNNPHFHVDPDGGWDPFGNAIKNWLGQKATEYIAGGIYSAFEGNSTWYDPNSWSRNANIASNFGATAVGAIASMYDVSVKVFKRPEANSGSPQDRAWNNNRLGVNIGITRKDRIDLGELGDGLVSSATNLADCDDCFFLNDGNAQWSGRFYAYQDHLYDDRYGVKFHSVNAGILKGRNKYTKLNFIQTVVTNQNRGYPFNQVDQQFIDSKPGHDGFVYRNGNGPFDGPVNSNREGFDIAMSDAPTGVDSDFFVEWTAETSIVGLRNGKWERISTVSWGYRIPSTANRALPIPPIIRNSPSQFHLNAISSR